MRIVSLIVHGMVEASASNETPDWFTIHHYGNESQKQICQSYITTNSRLTISIIVLIITIVELTVLITGTLLGGAAVEPETEVDVA